MLSVFGRKKDIYHRITIEEAKMRLRSEYEPPWEDIDEGIKRIVKILFMEGVETTESCEGGPGHAFPDPTVKFCGEISAGWKALSVALAYDLKPVRLRRTYYILDKEPVGPEWEMTFRLPGQK
jgi:hypothetical protein